MIEDEARVLDRAQRDGLRYSIRAFSSVRHGANAFFRTREEAEQRRDRVLEERDYEMTSDDHETQGSFSKLSMWIEHFNGNEWVMLPGSERTILTGFTPADPKVRAQRRRMDEFRALRAARQAGEPDVEKT